VTFKHTGREIFVNYIRRARVIAGVPYYVMPIRYNGCRALRGGGPESMALWDGSGGGGAGDAAEIEQGTTLAGGSSTFGRSNIRGLVPDGVATVTVHYAAGKIGGFDRNHAPAFTTTTAVVGNLLAVTIPRGRNRLLAPMTMIWRAADGTIIKTFHRL
jgi:hypothetical protein